MTQITARKALLIAAILLIASVLITGAFALSIHNTLFSANLNGASFQFNYRPPVSAFAGRRRCFRHRLSV